MAAVYATLIIKGMKTYTQVPERLREQVREILRERGREDLIDK